jgi:hypothetical protein
MSEQTKITNFNVVPTYGTDLDALNGTYSFGSKAGFPSVPTNITTNNPIADLGLPRIASQLLEARDRGMHRDFELARINHAIAHSYLGLFQLNGTSVGEQDGELLKLFSTTKTIKSDDGKTDIEVDNDEVPDTACEFSRIHFRQQAIQQVVKVFSESAMTNSDYLNIVFSSSKKINKVYQTTNIKRLGKLGNFNDTTGNDAISNGYYDITAIELNLLTKQTALLSAAAFVQTWKLFMTQAHALTKKYPQYDAKISALTGKMHKSAYATVIRTLDEYLKTQLFDFDEWNTLIKPLVISSTRNEGGDDPILVNTLRFIKPEPYNIAISDLTTNDHIVPGSLVKVDTRKLIKDASFYNDALNYIFNDSSAQTPDNFLDGQIRYWNLWADTMRKTFLMDDIGVEVMLRNGITMNWQTGFNVEYDRHQTYGFDNYQTAYDILTMSALGGAKWDTSTQTYVIEVPYYRIQDGILPLNYTNQGYYKTW